MEKDNIKKIGLLTYHASHNMGSMLQAYAMQNILRTRFSGDVEIINFSTKKQQEMYGIYDSSKSIKSIIKNFIIFLLKPLFLRRYNDFENFKIKRFHMTPQLYENEDEMQGVGNAYDVIVCGSDQIWNTNCIDYSDAYYLSFAKNVKKISYAPSFGGKNIFASVDSAKKIKEYLEDFDYISVREKNGKNWLESNIHREVELVPDPTLLVDFEEWKALEKEREFDFDYLFFYGSVYDKRVFDTLHYISKATNLKIVMLNLNAWLFKGNFYKGVFLSKHSSPEDYLSLISNAKMIITTSFHGTIFSTIYRKDFWTLSFRESNPDDDRLKTLLEQLSLSDRMFCLEDVKKYDLLEKVDYSEYDNAISKLKKFGFDYLERAMK